MIINRKGFTLIELLAVIVVLAILALVVTPIVLNIVENAQQGSDERSLEQYAKVLMTSYYEEKMNNTALTLEEFLNIVDVTDSNASVVSLSYNGSVVVCPKANRSVELASSTGNMEIVLKHCEIDGRGYYKYKDGRASKCVKEQSNGTTTWNCD